MLAAVTLPSLPTAVTTWLMLFSVTSIFACAVTMSFSVFVTRWLMPFPSTITLATLDQSLLAPSPAIASATMPTWVVVSTNQA